MTYQQCIDEALNEVRKPIYFGKRADEIGRVIRNLATAFGYSHPDDIVSGVLHQLSWRV